MRDMGFPPSLVVKRLHAMVYDARRFLRGLSDRTDPISIAIPGRELRMPQGLWKHEVAECVWCPPLPAHIIVLRAEAITNQDLSKLGGLFGQISMS
jgi:hypothetical protein